MADTCQRCGQATRKPEHTLCLSCWIARSRILTCESCKSDKTILESASGPHAGAVRCVDCNAFRWLSKKDLIFLRSITGNTLVESSARPSAGK